MARQQSLVLTAVEKKEKIEAIRKDIHFVEFNRNCDLNDAKVAKEDIKAIEKRLPNYKVELKELNKDLAQVKKVKAKRVRK